MVKFIMHCGGSQFRLAAVLLSVAACAQAQTYSLTNVPYMVAGPYCQGNMNNSGQIATVDGVAALYSGGTFTLLGTLPGGTYSGATAVNDSGQVVGYSNAGTAGIIHAFLYSGGTMIDLGTLPGGTSSFACAINNRGQVVGYTYNVPVGLGVTNTRAFLYSGGTMIDLGSLEVEGSSYAFAINDSGQVAGYSSFPNSGGYDAFLYTGGTMFPVGSFGGSSFAYGINNSGQVVGASNTFNGATHAFLYTWGTLTDMSTLPGGKGCSAAYGINDSGQIVGWQGDGPCDEGGDAFLYSGGTWSDLNTLVTLTSPGQWLAGALLINNRGQILSSAEGPAKMYVLTPVTLPAGPSSLSVLNPFAPFAASRQAPPTLTLPAVLSSPAATSLAADGESAVVLAYQSTSPQPVTFTLPGGGTLGPFDPNYLAAPNPPAGGVSMYQVTTPTSGPDAGGNYVFLALLWSPGAMPVPNVPLANIAVIATQFGQGGGTFQASIALEPPPLLLVHGIWSSASEAGFTPGSHGFNDWIAAQYPHSQIYPVDYRSLSSQAFNLPAIQGILLSNMSDALAGVAASGMAARSVDVVAQGMGGLVARYFESTEGYLGNPALLLFPLHQLITIGTPYQGTPLATALETDPSPTAVPGSLPWIYCAFESISPCNLVNFFSSIGRQVDTALASLEPGSPELAVLRAQVTDHPMVGLSTVPAQFPAQITEPFLNSILGGFLPGQTVETILSTNQHDTFVPPFSQAGGDPIAIVIPGVVHTSFCGAAFSPGNLCPDTEETASQAVWSQAYYWLTGGVGVATGTSLTSAARIALPRTTATPPPTLNLSGYTQVAPSNATLLPATGSILTINSASNITATSATKTIIEVLLLQTVTDPTDTAFFYATQSPFSISFTPARLGTANFGAVVVFNDNTYATAMLNYTLQPSGAPYALSLLNAPVASMSVGDSRVVQASALFPSGPINVTQVATSTAQSGSASVFSVGAGGAITANGNGVDRLNVAYGGVSATAPIVVGSCTYALNPANQILPYTGGTATIQVTTQSGCAWTASGGAAWLSFAQASGVGSGAITLTAAANGSGGNQGAVVYLAGLQALVTQPSTACSYGLSQTVVNAPGAGASGTITATTACPVVATSNQSWLTATALGSSVQYVIAPNNATSPRGATLTVGSVAVPVTQSAFNPCDVAYNGNIGVADVQIMVSEALGTALPVNDLSQTGVVNVVDVQIEINAARGLVCLAQ